MISLSFRAVPLEAHTLSKLNFLQSVCSLTPKSIHQFPRPEHSCLLPLPQSLTRGAGPSWQTPSFPLSSPDDSHTSSLAKAHTSGVPGTQRCLGNTTKTRTARSPPQIASGTLHGTEFVLTWDHL